MFGVVSPSHQRCLVLPQRVRQDRVWPRQAFVAVDENQAIILFKNWAQRGRNFEIVVFMTRTGRDFKE